MKRTAVSSMAEVFLGRVEERISEIRRDAARDLLRSLAARTPVGTGAARGNWQVLSESASYEGGPPTRSTEEVVARNAGAIGEAPIEQPIRLVNGTPYIRALEYGRKDRTAHGRACAMVRLTSLHFRDIVERNA